MLRASLLRLLQMGKPVGLLRARQATLRAVDSELLQVAEVLRRVLVRVAWLVVVHLQRRPTTLLLVLLQLAARLRQSRLGLARPAWAAVQT